MSPAPVKKTPAAVRLAVVIGGLIVLAVGGYFLLVQPLKSKASSLTKEIAAKTQEINDRNSQSQQAAGLSKILVADYFKLTTAMPDEPQVPELYLQLDAIARNAGVSFDGITPAAVVDASAYQVIPFALSFEGNFLHLSDFLRRLQSLVLVENHKLVARGRLFTIDQVSFTEGTLGFPDIAAKVQVNAYVYGHPVTVASTGAATGGSTSTTGTETTSTSTTSTTTTPTSTSP
ncbi:MAG: type 4a pilus biogenesis protein PilO [Gaiellaceae bacterium]